MVEMREDGTGPVGEWPYCPECGGILNFAGECPNGHRMNEINDMTEYKCTACNERFETFAEAANHVGGHAVSDFLDEIETEPVEHWG